MALSARFLLLVLSSWMILASCVLAAPINPEDPIKDDLDFRLPNDTVPIHYNIALNPYIGGNFSFDGEASIEFEVRQPTTSVHLHTFNLTFDEDLTSVTRKNGAVFVPLEHAYNPDTEILKLVFEKLLEPDIYILRLKYQGYINDEIHIGFYRSFYTNDEGEQVWLVTTHFEPTTARMAFPCWDEPALKATFNISVKHYANYTVLSNMPAYELSEVDTDGRMWTRFETTPRMSTYLVVVVVQDFVKVPNEDGTINVWSRSNALNSTQLMHEYAQKCEAALTKYMNSTVRVPKMDHIAIPHYSSRATEHWGAITYVEEAFLYDEEKNSVLAKQSTAMLAAHELTHTWFGNVVSPLWWNDLWLSEAFAVYYQNYIIDKVNPDWRVEETFVTNVVLKDLFMMDTNPHVSPIRPTNITDTHDITRVFNFITYRKGAAIVRMMSHILTEDVFHKGIVNYVNAHEYGSATSADLFAALQNALDESDLPHGGFNLSEVMLPWIEQVNYPLVTVTRDYTTGEMTITQVIVRATHRHYQSDEDRQLKWWVPLNFATKSNPDFSKTVPTHWLKPTDEKVNISGVDADDWVIFNIQQTGYYCVNYDIPNWRKIAKYLNSDDFTKISPLNRASIITNAYRMMLTGKISPVVYLEITNYLWREDDFIPWQAAFNVMDDLFYYISVLERNDLVKSHVLGLMGKVIDKVGFDDDADESDLNKILRTKLRLYACRLGSPQCLGAAARQLKNLIENPNVEKEMFRMLEDKRAWVFCEGIAQADEQFWNRVYDLYMTTHIEKIVPYLACVQNSTILENYMNLMISDSSPIPPNRTTVTYLFMIENNKDNLDFAIDYFTNNHEKIMTIFPFPDIIPNRMTLAVTNRSQLEKVKKLRQLIGIRDNTSERLQHIARNENMISKLDDWLTKAKNPEPSIDNALK